MCLSRGIAWNWSFEEFCTRAHGESQGIKEALYREFPELLQQEPNWDILYNEKKTIYTQFLQNKEHVSLMPGVEKLLSTLQEKGYPHCVVTNSIRAHVEMIQHAIPLLRGFSHWITREDYLLPKPSAEGYKKALSLYSFPKEEVIGFEDTLKGFKALYQCVGCSVLICPAYRSHIQECLRLGGVHFTSFEAFNASQK